MGQAVVNTKLKGDNTEFVNSVRGAGKALQGLKAEAARAKQMTEGMTKAGGLLKGALGSLFGGVIAVKGGMEAFDKALQSTQATGDAWNTQIAGLKGAVDSLFTTIATGDWSNLWRGLQVSAEMAAELAAAMDKVSNTKMARDYVGAKRQALIAKAKEVASDPNATPEEKKKAYDEATRYIDTVDKVNKEHIQSSRAAALSTINSATANLSYTAAFAGLPESGVLDKVKKELKAMPINRRISESDFDWLVTSGMTGTDPRLEQYKKDFEALRVRASKTIKFQAVGTGYGKPVPTQDAEKAQLELANLVKKNKDLELKRQQTNLSSDEKVQKALTLVQDALRTEMEVSNDKAKLNKTGKRIDLDDGGGSKGKTPPKVHKAVEIIPKGSIADIETQISKAEKQLKQATTDGARQRISTHIEALKKELEDIRVRIRVDKADTARGLTASIAEMEEALGKATTDKARNKIIESIDDLRGRLSKLHQDEAQVRDTIARNSILLRGDLLTNGQASKASETIERLDSEIRSKRFELQIEVSAESQRRLEQEIQELLNKRDRQVRIRDAGRDPSRPTALIGGLPRGGVKITAPTDQVDSWSDHISKATEANREMLESMRAVGGIFDVVGGIIGGNSGEMLKWSGNVIQAVTQALPSIAALTAAQKGQTIAGVAATSSILGPIATIGAIGSVLGAFLSLPKFAQGGIVGGSSYYGDKILARVNSGEMITTARQQEHIYRAMEEGRGRVFAQHISLGGEFKIRGGDLVVALDRARRYNGR